jgi:hypothetical protein
MLQHRRRLPADTERKGRRVNDRSQDDLRVAPPDEGLAGRRDRLYARLEAGWAAIDRVEAAEGDAERLIDFWLGLLREYERSCDALAAAVAAATEPAAIHPSGPDREG